MFVVILDLVWFFYFYKDFRDLVVFIFLEDNSVDNSVDNFVEMDFFYKVIDIEMIVVCYIY